MSPALNLVLAVEVDPAVAGVSSAFASRIGAMAKLKFRAAKN